MSSLTYENGECSGIYSEVFDDSESISDFITKDFVEDKVKNDEEEGKNKKNQSGYLFEGIFLDDIEQYSFNDYQAPNTFQNHINLGFEDLDFIQDPEKPTHGNTENPHQGDIEETKNNQIYPLTEKLKSKNRSKNNPLLLFTDNPNSNMKKGKNGEKKKTRDCPKKEYFRTKLIRSWKKTIRKLANPKTTSSKAESLFQKHLKTNFSTLSQISCTASGPMTEAQSKREGNEKEAKTYNNSYVFELFSDLIYRESFKLYIFSLFEGKTCKELCNRFYFNCCFNNSHSESCEEKWKVLKNFSFTDLIGRFNN
jgi:hypothetical protein